MVFMRSSFNEKRMKVNQNTSLIENMGKAIYMGYTCERRY